MVGSRVDVKVNPEIAELLHGEERDLITALEKMTQRHIVVYPHEEFHMEQVEINEILGE